ncbi:MULTISPECIES: TRAP transporter substrate-binding protein [Halomonadaceae]|jgi:tripartite ATP-independent transporter DctP family solute receptor|uniref:TRAP transporter substrate-binding protein n=2 Tax=Billgrantia TaxID=3137761 RepID=A0ABS9AN47_9GAMM|nr:MULTISPECIES: TRAP transporter substrate-binding protein [Halomonas]MCE8023248.1 TRAP transporter substrate-binding protein [Halomonas aerodenitrificans]MCE8040091.1 TRAP transporter substrate-binding protein [Halomonas sp. MCCC 1A11062]MCE8050049.1 TRAP transporter substrate-binding protein [Halomonas desiderata]
MFKRLVTGAVLGAALIGSQSLLAAEVTLRFGHLANEQNIWHQAAERFKELVEENSDGRIEVLLYPNEQLGNEMDLINSIQLGTADMTITGESLQNWAPKAAMMAVPYAFRDAEHLRQAVESEIGEQIEAQIAERANLVPLAWFERGPRELTSNRPIRHPDDLDGIRLRVPNVPLFVSTWEALGARPTPMAFSEVFTALQQNTIQAQENPLSLIESASFNEVQDYVNLTGHVRSWIYVVIGRNRLESMPEELQQIVREAAQEMQVYQAELFEEDQQRLEQALQERGMEFVEVDTEAFAEKARPAVEAALNDEQRELFDAIQNL